ncbi:hypothetical protein CEP52_003845 [Fusarium oligoseptatum]|uniref:T6SS Phospholipase effector Tle1-like catalytic domain-containing protein n=1 Tax=Fusarium oligoseptatum TaxID=2604345 RepID=A0A428U6K5_9HYPO|nr:hypothetical protein CEP52_003845 [Fusarium oligoseptatum]
MAQPRTYDKDFISRPAPAAKPKRIVICCDGTWQSATTIDPKKGCPSNVARFSRVLAKTGLDREKNEWQQLVYYDAGVGTGDITGVEATRQGSQGLGLLENVLEAYNFIVSNYSHGDELYFFGFSRGAFTVRATAGLVQEVGIIKSHLMSHFLEHYGNFIRGENFTKSFTETSHWTKFIAHSDSAVYCPGKDTVIQVIGVWDTVGALGIPDMGHLIKIDNSRWRKAYQFHNTDLSANVKHAYQALALDERRGPFAPCLCSDNVQTDEEKQKGTQPKGDREKLSSVAYAWMLDRVRPHLALNEEALKMQLAEIEAVISHPDDPKMLAWEENQEWLLGKIDDSFTKEYKAMGNPENRTPKEYFKPKEGEPEIGYTVERVHPSVHFRQEYHRNLNKKLKKPGWRWVKYKKGALDANKKPIIEFSMWEFEIGSLPDQTSVERWLIDRSWNVKSDFEKIDQGWQQ